MKIHSIQITGVELTQPLKVVTDKKSNVKDWDIGASFEMGSNDKNQFMVSVDIDVIRTIGEQKASIKTKHGNG